jgi:hypothetical protein
VFHLLFFKNMPADPRTKREKRTGDRAKFTSFREGDVMAVSGMRGVTARCTRRYLKLAMATWEETVKKPGLHVPGAEVRSITKPFEAHLSQFTYEVSKPEELAHADYVVTYEDGTEETFVGLRVRNHEIKGVYSALPTAVGRVGLILSTARISE